MARTPSDPPADQAPTDTAPETAKASTERLRLHRAFPVDAFEHTIDGTTYTVTDNGVDVPVEHHEAIIAAAKDAGLTVKKVSE